MRALVTGATGFVGQRLMQQLQQPVVLTRDVNRAKLKLNTDGITFHAWNPLEGPPNLAAFDGVDTVLHLAGEPVADGRWTASKKQRIRDSREIGTRNLVSAMRQLNTPPALISCSAIGYYGPRGEEIIDENTPPGDDFLSNVCQAWEKEAAVASEFGARVVLLRVGVVLGRSGGALKKMLTPFRMGLGGRLASGQQWMSWVHLDDVVGLLLYAANEGAATQLNMQGKYNAVAPGVVRNIEFTKILAKVLRRPAIFPMPAFMLKLLLGELSCLLLDSQNISPKATLASGYEFKYPELQGTLENLTSSPSQHHHFS